MRALVVGLGSMGKRRIRNLKALGKEEIAGFDVRKDRREEAREQYHVSVFNSFEEAISEFKPKALIISTSPQEHLPYIRFAVSHGMHCFIEASVVHAEKILALYRRVRNKPLVIAPSCTMKYYPGPKRVKQLVADGLIGKILNINYHVGQYLPDWHPWEGIGEYYVSQRPTGGCREIVPFELTWLNDIWGSPKSLALVKDKLTDMKADIDDIYHCLLRYGSIICNLTVDVIARPKALRELRILGADGIIEWSSEEQIVRYCNTTLPEWTVFPLEKGTVESKYINPEEPYVNELKDFFLAVETGDKSRFPNDLKKDYEVLKVLLDLEGLGKKRKQTKAKKRR